MKLVSTRPGAIIVIVNSRFQSNDKRQKAETRQRQR